jgi:solute carrier family 9 (sodium/hydrogen exchanger), member 8
MYFGWDTTAFVHNEHVIVSVNYLIFTVVLSSCLLLQHLLTRMKFQVIPASGASILVSMIFGMIIRSVAVHAGVPTPNFLINFSSELFYFGLLPPIIFNSGFHIQRQSFFHNLDSIFSLAFLGTFLSTVTIGYSLERLTNSLPIFLDSGICFNLMEAIAFGALLSSTDPVATLSIYQRLGIERNLYNTVFGESVLNDAVAITMFKLASSFINNPVDQTTLPIVFLVNVFIIFVGSMVIGYGIALMLALIFKHLSFQGQKLIPTALILSSSFIPFLLAEMLQLSGIVAIFFAGIASRRYIVKNSRDNIKISVSNMIECLSYVAETSCFVIMGLVMMLQDHRLVRTDTLTFVSLTFVLCIVVRVFNTFGLLFMVSILLLVWS